MITPEQVERALRSWRHVEADHTLATWSGHHHESGLADVIANVDRNLTADWLLASLARHVAAALNSEPPADAI